MKKCPTIKVLNLCQNKPTQTNQRTSTRNSLSDLFMKTSYSSSYHSHSKYKFPNRNRTHQKQPKKDSQSNTDRQQQQSQFEKLRNKQYSNLVSGIVTPLGQNKHKNSNSIGKSGSLHKYKYDNHHYSPHLVNSHNTFNIKTFIRLRPFTLHQLKSNPTTIENFQLLSKTSLRIGDNAYNFNRIFQIENSQRDVYDQCGKQVISKFLQGYNCTVFAYGQTGSGKTYTMFGDGNEGLVPFAVKDIFSQLERRQQLSNKQTHEKAQKDRNSIDMTPSSQKNTKISCSMLQIYKENLIDLLAADTVNPPQLKIKQTPSGLHVNNLTVFPVKSEQQLFQLLYRGSQMKKMRQTNLNEQSSRSHLIFTVYLETQLEDSNVRFNKLNLIDLAGSQKVSKSKVQGQGLQQAKKINFSLSCLGNTINALVKHHEHIPFRQSKLTRLLQDSFTGNSLTSLVITCSIHESCVDETISSLKFGARASKVRTFADIDQNIYNEGQPYNGSKNLVRDPKKKKVERFVYDTLKQKYEKLQQKLDQVQKIIQQKYLALIDSEIKSSKSRATSNIFDLKENLAQAKCHNKTKSVVPYDDIKIVTKLANGKCSCREQEMEFYDQLLKKIRCFEAMQQTCKIQQKSLTNSAVISCNKKKEIDIHIGKGTNKSTNITSLASPTNAFQVKRRNQNLAHSNKIISLTFQNTETQTFYEPESQKLLKRVNQYLNQYEVKQQKSVNEQQQPPIIKRQFACTPTLPITITQNYQDSGKTYPNQTSSYSIKKHQDKDLFHKQEKFLIMQAEKINNLLKIIKKCSNCKQKLKQLSENDHCVRSRASQEEHKQQHKQTLKVKKLLAQSKHISTPSDINQSSKEEASKYPSKYKLKINRKKKDDENNLTEQDKIPLSSHRNKSIICSNDTKIISIQSMSSNQLKKQHDQLLNAIQRLIQNIQNNKKNLRKEFVSEEQCTYCYETQKIERNQKDYKQLLEDTLKKLLDFFYKNSKSIETAISDALIKNNQFLLKISQNDKEQQLIADIIHDAKCYSIQRDQSQFNFSSKNSNKRILEISASNKKHDKESNIEIKGFTTHGEFKNQNEFDKGSKIEKSPLKSQKVIDVDIAKLIYDSKKSNTYFKNGKYSVKPFQEKLDHDQYQTLIPNCVPKGHNCRARTIVLQYTFDQFHRKNQQISILKHINEDLNAKLANLVMTNQFLEQQIKFIKEKSKCEYTADYTIQIN